MAWSSWLKTTFTVMLLVSVGCSKGPQSGKVLDERPLSGVPDVVFFNRQRQHLYVAIGDPGVIDVFSTSPMAKLATIETEAGCHTTALSPAGDRLYAFLPRTHRAAIYQTSEVTP